jgi:hypothetical protein
MPNVNVIKNIIISYIFFIRNKYSQQLSQCFSLAFFQAIIVFVIEARPVLWVVLD